MGLLGTGLHSRGEGKESKKSSICTYNCSPSHTLLPEVHLLSDHSHRSTNPTVNYTCKGSRLHASYENWVPDDLILHYGELYNYFVIYHNVIIIEIKYMINVMHLNHPETILSSQPPPPLLWKNCLPQNQSLMPKRLGIADIHDIFINSSMLYITSLFLQVGSLGTEWLVFCFSSVA